MTVTSSSRSSRFLGRALVCILVFAACGGSGSQKLHNAEFGVSFTIDADWAVYDEGQFSGADLDLGGRAPERRLDPTWLRGFDGSDEPSPANVARDDAPAPRGMARIQVLTEQQRTSVDLAALRSVHLGFDPVRAERDEPDGPVEILRHEDLSLEGGQHGVRMVVVYDTPGGDVGVVDQTALLDGANSVLYLLVVGCSERCYADNQDTIEAVADSLTFEKR